MASHSFSLWGAPASRHVPHHLLRVVQLWLHMVFWTRLTRNLYLNLNLNLLRNTENSLPPWNTAAVTQPCWMSSQNDVRLWNSWAATVPLLSARLGLGYKPVLVLCCVMDQLVMSSWRLVISQYTLFTVNATDNKTWCLCNLITPLQTTV
jgi:hypothetical protein